MTDAHIMDSTKVEIEFICPVCSSVATEQPVLAEDGFIYHKECANDCTQPNNSYLSQVTGRVVGGLLISLVKPATELLQPCKDVSTDDSEEVLDTKMKAQLNDPQSMARLGEY